MFGLGPLLAAPATLAADADAARAEYRAALADLYAVRLDDFEMRLERLADHPLRPYLEYQRLMRYVSAATPEEIAAFRERWAATPLADRVLVQWLDNLARRGEWATYRDAFDGDVAGGDEAVCRFHRAQFETGAVDAAFAGARRLWLVDHSQPKVCDPLFDAWIAAGGIDDAIAWQRIHIALEANRPTLAAYLVRFLDEDRRRLATEHVALHRAPRRIVRLDAIPGGDGGAREAEVVAHTIRRLARRDSGDAAAAWARWAERLDFPEDEQRLVREEIVRQALRQERLPENLVDLWPPPELADGASTELLEELGRDAIARGDWDEVEFWIGRLPEWARSESRWQYWSAHIDLERARRAPPPPRDAEARALALPADDADPPVRFEPMTRVHPLRVRGEARLVSLARQRNYYGFLAADRIGLPFALRRARFDVGELEIEAMARHPAMRRAGELRAVGELPEARREMYWLMDRLGDRELLALAEHARRIDWPRMSIQATIVAEHWDHVDLRFPLAFRETMLGEASARELDPAWLYAIARQESAFMADARSSAGALGLMQLMPATARLMARQSGVPLDSTWQLLDERRNVELGALYLQRMYERFDRNRILASAAYNAGPARVERWMRERPPSPVDVWIESIPFRETRGYVQNVLAYAVIYADILGIERPFLADHER